MSESQITDSQLELLQKELENLSPDDLFNTYAELEGYSQTPVSIDRFIEDNYYIGNIFGGHYQDGTPKIYPYWREKLREIYPNPFHSPYIEVCLSGDTEVDLLDGRSLTMKQICEEFKDKTFSVLSYDTSDNGWKPAEARLPRKTGIKPVWKVTLDNGESFKATEYHPILTKNNKWKEIKDLKVGDSLKNYNKRNFGTQRTKQVWCHNSKSWKSLHRLVAEFKFGYLKDFHVHHKNRIHSDNRSPNLCVCTQNNHMYYHYHKGHRGPTFYTSDNPTFKGLENSRKQLDSWRTSFKEDEYLKILKERGLKGIKTRWDDKSESNPNRIHMKKVISKHMKESGQATRMAREFWSDPKHEKSRNSVRENLTRINREKSTPKFQARTRKNKVLAFINRMMNQFGLTTLDISRYNEYIELYDCKRKVRLGGIAKAYDCVNNPGEINADIDHQKLGECWTQIVDEAKNYNHRIVSIEYVGIEDVYNFEVDKYHNFPLTCGVVSHNCISGAIGTGKSTLAIIGLVYDLHRILLLKDPHDKFGLLKSTVILFALFNATKALASDVIASQINEVIESSDFFKSHIDPTRKTLFKNLINISTGSRFSHALGQAVIAAIMDEANFQNKVKNQALDNYRHIYRRMDTRYRKVGENFPCTLWLISSKQETSDFLESHIEQNRNKKTTLVIEAAIWEVHYHRGIYSGETFKVFIGDDNKDPFIIGSGDVPSHLESSRIIEAPVEYRSQFDTDLHGSLKDLAGVSTSSVFKLFRRRESIYKTMVVPPSFTSECISLSFDGDDAIRDFMTDYLLKIPKNHPRCIHVDTAVVGDRLGFAMSHNSGIKRVSRINLLTAKSQIFEENVVRTDCVLGIEAQPGSEIPFFKVREFIEYLREIGFVIEQVSTDGFQSVEFKQLLRKKNFKTELISVDRTKEPYYGLRQAILEGRSQIPQHELLLTELKNLMDTGKKIDHPENFPEGKKGSKDIADAVAGSHFAVQDSETPTALGNERMLEQMRDHIARKNPQAFLRNILEKQS